MRQVNRKKSGVLWALSLSLALLSTTSALAADATIEDLKAQIQELDQKLRILERKLELDKETSETTAKAQPVLSIGAKGVSMSSGDGNFQFRLKGYLQADSRWFIHDDGNATADTFLIRRARPIFEGTFFKKFEFRIMPDLAPSSVTLEDAYINYKIRPELQIQAGKFKAPVGLERLQSATSLSFAERGFPTGLLPNRDLGVQVHGSLVKSTIDYAVGAFNGTADGGSLVTDTDSGKDVAVRLFSHPFRNQSNSWARGFGVGAAATYGNHKGAPRQYVTPGQQSFFTWAAGVENDGGVWRFSPQAYYYVGPFGFLAEYASSSHEVSLGAEKATVRNDAWQVLATWVLTGEEASYRGVTPRHPLDFSSGHFGAFELAARYGELDVDNDVFPIFGNPDTRASRARTVGVGLNWYLNSNVKVATDYAYTTFTGGGDGPVSGQPEHVLFTRVQLAF